MGCSPAACAEQVQAFLRALLQVEVLYTMRALRMFFKLDVNRHEQARESTSARCSRARGTMSRRAALNTDSLESVASGHGGDVVLPPRYLIEDTQLTLVFGDTRTQLLSQAADVDVGKARRPVDPLPPRIYSM